MIMFQNARMDAIEFVAVTSMNYTRANYSTIILTLNSQDIDELNLRSELASSIADTFLSLMPAIVEDVLGQRSPGISMDNAQQVSVYIRDQIRPDATAFYIDLNNYTVTLEFNEIADPQSINMTFLIVQNSSSSSTLTFSFTGHEAARRIGRRIIIALTQTDVDDLNVRDICTSITNCFATVQSGFITDVAGNPILPSSPIPAANFTADIRAPQFEQFVLMNISSGIMILRFSETIDADSVMLNTLRLQSTADGSGADFRTLTLSGGQILSGSSSQLEIQLLQSDLNTIKLNSANNLLCTRRTDCYIRFPPGFATDAFNNPLPAVGNTIMPNSQHYPMIFGDDTTGPLVESFNLDLETGFIELSFNEIFQISSFTPTAITIQNAAVASSTYTLTGGTITSSNDTGVTVQLERIDALRIKGDPLLATSQANTYLVNTMALVVDVFDNQAVARIDGTNALLVNGFVDDVTAPAFVSFSEFSRESGQLRVRFSEPIDVTSVNYSLITLQSTSGGGVALQLTAGSSQLDTSDPTLLVITLSFTDQFTIKRMNILAVNRGSTYLAFEQEAFSDTAGIPVAGISATSAVQAANFIPDFQAPRLAGFQINMELGRLSLTYDDIIQPTVYNPLGITLQNAAQLPTQQYQLTGGVSLTTDPLGFVIDTTIIAQDLLQLKHRIGLATSIDDTFIAATPMVTLGANNNSVLPSISPAVQATSFIRDQTPPNITAFSLNLTTEILTVLANEPLDPSSFTPSGVSLQNSPNDTGLNIMSVTLTGGVALQSASSIFQLDIQLSNFDLNLVKQMTELATSITNVYLSLTSASFADFGGNGVSLQCS